MGFILDKSQGKGKATIKVNPDSKNTQTVPINKSLQIQVNGVTKAVVQLLQKGRSIVKKAFASSDKNSINGLGDEVKITYWGADDTTVVSENVYLNIVTTGTTASYTEISSGTNPDGTRYKVFKIAENTGEENKIFKVQAQYGTGETAVYSEVLTLTQGLAQVDVICIASTALIPPEGGTAKITYYAKSGSDIITDGVELEIIPPTSDAPQPTYSSSEGTNPLTGNYVEYIIGANTINKTKYIKVKAKYNGKYSKEVSIRQVGKDATVLPDFNFFTFTYGWESDAGRDFDSITVIEGTGIEVAGRLLDDWPVGYGMGQGNTNTQVQEYIKWGGDNMQSGAEGAEINWKKICEKDFISEGIYTIYAKIYGNWYGNKGTGLVTFNLKTYKGTGMVQDGFIFKPDDNTTLVTEQSKSLVCYAAGHDNWHPSEEGLNAKDCYTLLATVEYDIASKSALLVMNPNSEREGRDQNAGDEVPKSGSATYSLRKSAAEEEVKEPHNEGHPW